ncbi:MAG: HD-GYP domain-containing protein [Acidobacteriaceae bacterium]
MPNKILVVDDDHSQRMLLYEILSLDGFLVTCAADGKQAEQELQANPPDLILLDVKLPFRGGFEICADLKRNPETRLIPVVMVTGLTQTRDRIRGIEAGADDFLTKPIDRYELKARIHSLLKRKEYTDELDRAESVLMALGNSIEAKDPYTEGHCDRISRFSVLFGKELGFSRDELRALNIAGSAHDIGKIAVPDAILLKRGPLLDEEWEIMREHPVAGERICKPLRSFQLVLPIIRNHHEKQDGSGYPDGMAGEEVPLLARVMQIADIFDALTTDRPYRQALPRSQALEQMSVEVEKGWWDPKLFPVFASMAEKGAFDNGIKESSHVG